MEKVLFLLDIDQAPEALHGFICDQLLPVLKPTGAAHIHFALADHSMQPAADKTMFQPGEDFNVFLTFWLPTALKLDSWMAEQAERDFATFIHQHANNVRSFAVTESTVLDVHKQLDAASGANGDVVCLPGWQQVVTLVIPPHISREQWLETWLYSHADIACQVQSTFGYIHNIIQRATGDTVRAIDAIVTENFPDSAMTSFEAFYDAEGDPEKLQDHIGQMMKSCERFIDNSKINVVPMRAYSVL